MATGASPVGGSRNTRDASDQSTRLSGERGERRDRHLRIGVSYPSKDPARHRVFAVRASYDAAAAGWVAWVGEENANEQLAGRAPRQHDEDKPRVFPTPAACLGDAVAALVTRVDRETGDQS